MIGEVIIFDMDGTLYDLNDVVQSNYDMQVDFLSSKLNMDKKAAICFLEDHHVYPVIKKDSMSATELFLQIGLNKKEWSEYRDKRFDVNKIDISKSVDANTLIKFSEFGVVVLLSSNAYIVLEKVLNHLNISPLIFNEIICSDRFPYNVPFKKKKAMEYLSEKYDVDYSHMYSIGDRYSTDILPLLELGGKGILIKKTSSIIHVLSDMEKGLLESSCEYVFYNRIDK